MYILSDITQDPSKRGLRLHATDGSNMRSTLVSPLTTFRKQEGKIRIGKEIAVKEKLIDSLSLYTSL